MLKTWAEIAKKSVTRFMSDEEGQSTTEYILILAVVVMIAMKFKQSIGQKIGEATGKIGNDINSALQTDF